MPRANGNIVESLSVYARQFLDQMQRPDVDLIEGLQPTICIDQRAAQLNRRSTVATVTEIYDYLRLLMARLGQPHCYRCGEEIRQQSVEQIQDRVMELPEGTKVMIMAPMVRGRKGSHKEVFARIRKAGFVRARVDGSGARSGANARALAATQPPHRCRRRSRDHPLRRARTGRRIGSAGGCSTATGWPSSAT